MDICVNFLGDIPIYRTGIAGYGYQLGQTLGGGGEQGGLACCILLSHEESDKTWQLNNMVTRYVTILGTSRLFSISDTQYSPSVKWSYKSSDAGFP